MAFNYLLLNGSTDAINAGDITLAGDFTIAFLVNPVTNPGFQCVFSANVSGSMTAIALYLSSTESLFSVNGTLNNLFSIFTPVNINSSVFIIRSGGTLTLQVGGAPLSTYSVDSASVNLTATTLGSGIGGGQFLNAQFSYFGMWNFAFTSTEINQYIQGLSFGPEFGPDPTGIQTAHLAKYIPCQIDERDIFGSTTGPIGSPTLVGPVPSIAVQPEAVNLSATIPITVTGTHTNWEYTGTHAGQAPLMVSVGSLASIVLHSLTNQTASLTTPASGTACIVTDPTTGATNTLVMAAFVPDLTLRHTSVHSPGGSVLTAAWQQAIAPGSSVIFTPTSSYGTFSPTTFTLTSSGASTASVKFVVPGGYNPPISDVITVTNNSGGGAVPTVTLPFNIIALTAQLVGGTIQIMPCGNIWRAFTQTTGGSPTTVSVTGCDEPGAATITPNGGSPIPLSTAYGAMYPTPGNNLVNFIWGYLGKGRFEIDLDETEAVLTGSWSTYSVASFNYQLFTKTTGGNGSLKHSSGASDTAVYTFSGLMVGLEYNFYRNNPDIFISGDGSKEGFYSAALDFGLTVDQRYTFFDGTNTTIVDRDLTSKDYPVGSGDDRDLLYSWDLLATLTPASDTMVITITNEAMAGSMAVDGMRCRKVATQAIDVNSDTATVTADDNWINTSAGTVGPLSAVAVQMLDFEQAYNYSMSNPRTMKIGFVSPEMKADQCGRLTNNQAQYSEGWNTNGYNFSLDPTTGNLTSGSTTGGAVASLIFSTGSNFSVPTSNNDYDSLSTLNVRNTGTWTITFTAHAGVTLTVGSFDTATSGVSMVFAAGTHSWTFAIPYTGTFPFYNAALQLNCASDGNAQGYIDNIAIYPPGTDPTWGAAHVSDFDLYSRLTLTPGGFLRNLNSAAVNFSNLITLDEENPEDAIAYSTSRQISFPIASLQPVNNSTNPTAFAIANSIGLYSQGNITIFLIVFSSPHPYGPAGNQRWLYLNVATNLQLDTLGNTIQMNAFENEGWGLIVDNLNIIMIATISSRVALPGPTYATLATPYTAVGGDSCVAPVPAVTPSKVSYRVAYECGQIPWICFPTNSLDSYFSDLGQWHAATFPTKPAALEYANEPWNNNAADRIWNMLWMSGDYQNYLWGTTSGAQGAPLQLANGEPQAYPLRAGQGHAQYLAGFTDIPAVKINGFGTGATAVATITAGAVSAITVTNGGGNTGAGQLAYTSAPTITISGGRGSGATAMAHLGSGPTAGTITSITVNTGGSGWSPTGCDPNLIIRIMGAGAGQIQMAQAIGYIGNLYNIPFEHIAPANYTSCDMSGYSLSYANDFWDQLEADSGDLVDAACFGFIYSDTQGNYNSQVTTIKAYNPTLYAGVTLVAYEGMADILTLGNRDPGSDITRLIQRGKQCQFHPNFYYLTLGACYYWQDNAGFVAINGFTLDDNASGIPDMIQRFLSPAQGIGTGTPGENIGVWNQADLVSQEFGAFAAFSVEAITPTKLVVTTQPPSSTAAGAPFGLVVSAETSGGTVAPDYTANVTVAIGTNPSGGTLSGTTTVAAVAGVATFTGLSLDRSGVGYTLTATSGLLTSATTNPFAITASGATKLAVTSEPPGTVWNGFPFSLAVSVEDSIGNLVPGSTASVTIALLANPGSATLGGTLTRSAVAGVATFTGLTLNMNAVGYTIQATSSGLSSATSTAITVITQPMITSLSPIMANGNPNIIYAG